MPTTTDLNLLRAFAAVVETGSYTKAAEKLNCPKSWVSRAVTSLEDELGVRLLHRTTRSISMSTAGTTLYERIQEPLAALSRSATELSDVEGAPTGTLRIAATVDFGSTLLADIVTRFCLAYPNVKVDLRLSNTVVDIVGQGFDVALRFSTRQLRDSTYYARKLMAFGLGVYAAPSYLQTHGEPRSTKELSGHAWVQFSQLPSELEFASPDGPVTLRASGPVSCDEMTALRSLVLAGAGLGALPQFVAEGDLRAGRLVRLLPDLHSRSGILWFVAPSAKHLPAKVSAFRDFLIAALAQCPGEAERPSAPHPKAATHTKRKSAPS